MFFLAVPCITILPVCIWVLLDRTSARLARRGTAKHRVQQLQIIALVGIWCLSAGIGLMLMGMMTGFSVALIGVVLIAFAVTARIAFERGVSR